VQAVPAELFDSACALEKAAEAIAAQMDVGVVRSRFEPVPTRPRADSLFPLGPIVAQSRR
jgi:hypothetical protein